MFRPGELCGGGRTALALEVITYTTVDSDASIDRFDLILALFDACIRVDALVLVWVHAAPHPHDLVVDNDTVVSGVWGDLL